MKTITINSRVAFAGRQATRTRRGTAADRFRKAVRAACREAGVAVTDAPVALWVTIAGHDPRMSVIDAASAVKQSLVGCLVADSEQIVSAGINTDERGEPTVTIAWESTDCVGPAAAAWLAKRQTVDNA